MFALDNRYSGEHRVQHGLPNALASKVREDYSDVKKWRGGEEEEEDEEEEE